MVLLVSDAEIAEAGTGVQSGNAFVDAVEYAAYRARVVDNAAGLATLITVAPEIAHHRQFFP